MNEKKYHQSRPEQIRGVDQRPKPVNYVELRINEIARRIGGTDKQGLAEQVYIIETLLSEVKRPPRPAPLTRYEMIRDYGRKPENVHLVPKSIQEKWLVRKQINKARERLDKAKKNIYK